jgi:hypothetical protein
MKNKFTALESKSFFSLRLSVSVVSLLHLAITLPLACFLNIWADEASTLYTTEHGFFYAFQSALTDEKQAPLYFWVLSVWREINSSIFFARMPSIVFSLLAIKFFYDLARKFFSERAAAFLAAFFALHPFLIWASLEIRVYSLVIWLSVLLLKFFFDGYVFEEEVSREDAKAPRRAQVLYALTALAAVYANYYLGFLLVGNFFALFVYRRWRAARRYFSHMLMVGAAMLPLLWAIVGQFAVNTDRFQTAKSLPVGLRFLWNHFLTFALPTEIFPPDEATGISSVRVWLVRVAILAVVVPLVKRWRAADKNTLALAVICGVGFAFLLVAYFLLGEIYVEVRHAAFVFAPLVLFGGLVLKAVLRTFLTPRHEEAKTQGFKLGLAISFAALLAIFFGYAIWTLYPNAAKRGDWARVGAFLERNEQPGQPVLVFTTFDALALPYHYKGVNKILPDERFFAFEAEAETGSADAWRRQTEFMISEIPNEATEIWLLTNEKCAVKDACAPLENFAAANYTVIIEQDFYKEKVRLLRKKQK